MPRYFTRPRAWVGDDVWDDPQSHLPMVSDHQAVDTGLLDLNGDAIMRAPKPIGFGKDDEW
jgi:hypothetical protein